jgi:fatty-acyl-CoA synthase
MKSSMQTIPLSVSRLVAHGTVVHGDSSVGTWTGDGARSATHAEVRRRSAALAHALRELGVTGDMRVATFMFNNQEHLEAYLAVPSMGAVLHTLHIRLFPDQLTDTANHAEDHVVIVDTTVAPLLARILPSLRTVQHVVVNGPVDVLVFAGFTGQVHSYAELLAGRPTTFDWPAVDEDDAAEPMCRSRSFREAGSSIHAHMPSALRHPVGLSMEAVDEPRTGASDRPPAR